ncbi:MAG: protein kinase [Gemmatimonadaceae bacterium]
MASGTDEFSDALADRYRIEREIGAGGMAVVYLAEDLKHGRRVAIKVLREDRFTSTGAMRFLREIGIAAQLQHPNILPLLDSGEAAGLLYYVMPFVDGESLRQRLARLHTLPPGEASRVLREVADALSHAHAHGVVHRDIKPDNVMMSGRHALVTDFGVARAISAATGIHERTSVGIALGTPAYMAPEQVAADPDIDHRADLYALGVMGYELLAGRTPFSNMPPQQVLAAHVATVPESLDTICPDVPETLTRIVMKCLEKRPDDRWQTADELLAQLESVATTSGETAPLSARSPVAPNAFRRPVVVGGLALATLVASVLIVKAVGARKGSDAPSIVIGTTTQFTADDGLEIQPALSPDGNTVAYAAGNSVRMRIFVRPVRGGRSVALSDDSTSVEMQPQWSPDGSQLLYLSRGGVQVAPALGGESRTVVARTTRDSVVSATWSPDGKQVAFARGDSLYELPIAGGAPRLVGKVGELHSCAWSAVGDLIACVSGNVLHVIPGTNFGNIAPSAIVVFHATGGAPRPITDKTAMNQSPIWSADGRTLYFVSDRQGARDIYSLPIGADGSASGGAQRLTTGLGARSITLAANGNRLGYAVYRDQANVWTARIPTTSSATMPPLKPLTSGNQVIEAMRVSRDGNWLLFDSNLRGHAEIYRVRLSGGAPERLTDGKDDNYRADLAPNGKEIAYQSWRTGNRDLFVQAVDGASSSAQITATPGAQEAGAIWSPDGRALTFSDLAGVHGLYVVRRDASGTWGKPVQRGVAGPGSSDWSPDSRSIASVYNGVITIVGADSGTSHIAYAPRAGTDDPLAEQVVWRRDGSEFYFKSHDAAGRAMFWTIPTTGGRPHLLLQLDDLTHPSNRPDFAVDAERLYFVIQDRQSDVWIAELTHK